MLFRSFSTKVIDSSKYLDDTLSDYIGDDSNSSDENLTKDEQLNEEVSSVDQFFQSDKFTNETEKAYVRIRLDSLFQSKDEEKFNLKVSAQVPLKKVKQKSKAKFHLFISDLTEDNAKDIGQNDTEKTAPEIGVHYFAPEISGMVSRYSVGIKGVYPFVRARYSKAFYTENWSIEPTQQFKYSTKNNFEEETRIYFDTKPQDLSLFRLELSRGTKSEYNGMDYGLGLSYFFAPLPKAGIYVKQIFAGNTKYQYITDETISPVEKSKKFGGLYN